MAAVQGEFLPSSEAVEEVAGRGPNSIEREKKSRATGYAIAVLISQARALLARGGILVCSMNLLRRAVRSAHGESRDIPIASSVITVESQRKGDTLAQKSREPPPPQSYQEQKLMGIWRVTGSTRLQNLA
eukprot:1153164-Pelagomonas_calceolata.AAC.1